MISEFILFIHRGVSWYLHYAIIQARYYHPDARIAVITDEEPTRELTHDAEVHRLADYWIGAAGFEALPGSQGLASHDLFRLQRWFVVRDFLRKHGPARTICLDSDVLVYSPLFRDFDRIGERTLGVVGLRDPAMSLVPNAAVVERICARIESAGREAGGLPAEPREVPRLSIPASRRFPAPARHASFYLDDGETLDLSIPSDDAVYDTSIQEDEGFRFREGIKEITWVCSEPWVRRADTGQAVRLKTIHCDGAARCWILRFFTAKDLCFLDGKTERTIPSITGAQPACH